MKLHDLLEDKKLKASLTLVEETDDKKEEDDGSTTEELLASLDDVGDIEVDSDTSSKSDPDLSGNEDGGDADDSVDSNEESEDSDGTSEDDSHVFTLSVVDVLDQKTVFVKMGKEAAKDDDDADAAIDEADVVKQIVDALGGKTEVTGTMESLKEEGIDLSDMFEYYEKELQEKIETVEELEAELGIEGTEQDEDEEGLHGELEDTGIMTGIEDSNDDESEFPVDEYPSESSYHLSTLDRHGVNPDGYNAKLDFGSDNMMDSMASLHPESRESEYYDY